MEEQNKHTNTQKQDFGGTQISVRPGNFVPPPSQKPKGEGAPTQNANRNVQASGEGVSHEGGNRNRRNRHKRHKPKNGNPAAGNGTPSQGQEKKQQSQEKRPQPQNRQNQGQKQKNPQPQKGDNRQMASVTKEGKGKNRHHGKEQREENARREHSAPQNAPKVSDSLQRSLDADFATPTLSSFSQAAQKKNTPVVEDTEEFAVDIATAAYLVEDVPSGFPVPDGKAVEVVGVRFRAAGKVYFFSPAGQSFRVGEHAIVDTARGAELGEVVMKNRKIAERDVVQPLRTVLRRATPDDLERDAKNRELERDALRLCAEKIAAHKLDMRLVDAQFTFDNSKLLFYFTADGRVDFRDLVRDLAGAFHTRIELRQIGIRDESRLIGGLGMCGRPFCCSTFLNDFGQVSIKMAKEQNLSLNTSKISGCCGRLMCCLRYEQESYAAEAKLTPPRDSVVETPDGRGTVLEATPLSGMLKVQLENAGEEPPRNYHRDSVTVISRGRGKVNGNGKESTKEKDTDTNRDGEASAD